MPGEGAASAGRAGPVSMSPSISSRSDRGIAPARKRRGGPSPRARTVDSIPTGQRPPSTTASMRPLRSRRTWAAGVGGTCSARVAGGGGGGGGGDGLRAVRGGSGERRTDAIEERAGRRMRRSPHGDGGPASGDLVGNDVRAREDERERAWPEARGELHRLERPSRAERARLPLAEDVDDERIRHRTALRGVDGADGEGLESEPAESVDRLGGKGY